MSQLEERYNFKQTEPKWQKQWLDKNSFKATDDKSKKKCFVLEMFPYPVITSYSIHYTKLYDVPIKGKEPISAEIWRNEGACKGN